MRKSVLAIILVPLLYVLSIGPAAKLGTKGILSHDAYFTFYAPIHRLVEASEWWEVVISSYLRFWLFHM